MLSNRSSEDMVAQWLQESPVQNKRVDGHLEVRGREIEKSALR